MVSVLGHWLAHPVRDGVAVVLVVSASAWVEPENATSVRNGSSCRREPPVGVGSWKLRIASHCPRHGKIEMEHCVGHLAVGLGG